MTETNWHAPAALLTRFLDDPGGLDDVAAASIEAHLVACASCRQQLTAAADPHFTAASWDAVADRIDQPRAVFVERLLHGLGVGKLYARLLAATPGLQAAGLGAVALLAAAAVALSRTADAQGPFLVLAPLAPLAAVALTFATAAEPAGEAAVATPMHGAGLVVRRAVAVLTLSFVLLGVAALAVPDFGPTAAAWVLPAFALSLGSLAGATRVRVEVAVAALGIAWLVVVWSVWTFGGQTGAVADSASFAAAGQVTAFVFAVAGAVVVGARRDHFATLEAFR
jgi:hypothetical protein